MDTGNESAKELTPYRIYLVLGLIIYPSWALIYQYFVPGSIDPFLDRGLVGAASGALGALSLVSRWVRRHLPTLTYLLLFTITAHFFYILRQNHLHPAYIIGAFITVCAVSATFGSVRFLLAYSIATIALAWYAGVSQSAYPDPIFILGLATVLLVSFIALSLRLRMYQRTVEQNVLLTQQKEELRELHQRVAALLDNMRLAVFSVDAEGKIVGPVSRYSETVFSKNVDGSDIFQTLFKTLPPGSEERSAVNTVLSTIYGEGELQWSLMEDHLPSRVTIVRGGSAAPETRTLRVSYTPLWNDHQTLDRLMLVVEDITDLLRLEKDAENAKAENAETFQILQELAEHDAPTLETFFNQATKILFARDQLTGLPENPSTKTPSNFDLLSLYRDLHTLKGNARVYKLSMIASEVHRVENHVCSLRDKPSPSPVALEREEMQSLASDLGAIQQAVDKYTKLATKIFKVGSKSHKSNLLNTVPVIRKNLENLFTEAKTGFVEGSAAFAKLKQRVLELKDVPAGLMTGKFSDMVSDISRALGKEVDFSVLNEETPLDRDHLQVLQDALVHLIRNSLDHGIEAPEARLGMGKPKSGKIELSFSRSPHDGADWLEIVVKDDGQGINPDRVWRKAVEQNLVQANERLSYSDQSLLELIFAPGFSTRETVTEISGRGVGMDIVRSSIEKLGGRIVIKNQTGQGCEIVLQVPQRPPSAGASKGQTAA